MVRAGITSSNMLSIQEFLQVAERQVMASLGGAHLSSQEAELPHHGGCASWYQKTLNLHNCPRQEQPKVGLILILLHAQDTCRQSDDSVWPAVKSGYFVRSTGMWGKQAMMGHLCMLVASRIFIKLRAFTPRALESAKLLHCAWSLVQWQLEGITHA